MVDRALERDHAAASAEFLAQFRNDLEAFVSYEVVTGLCRRLLRAGTGWSCRYGAFVDPSGGSADAFTMAIGHRAGDRIVIDATRETKPPFSPEAVIDDFAALLRMYRVHKVRGDRYAGEFPRELFRKKGISYECSEKAKSDLYRDLLPLLNSGRIVLPKNERLVNQLCGLERRTARSARTRSTTVPEVTTISATAWRVLPTSSASARRCTFPPQCLSVPRCVRHLPPTPAHV